MILKKKAPYADTDVSPEKTQFQITKLLKDYGASGVQWSQIFEKNFVELKFALEIELKGEKKTIFVKVSPPAILGSHRQYDPKTGRNERINAPNWAQSYRLLFYWLKSKLEAISYEIVSAEEEFLSQIVIKLPSGVEISVYDAVIQSVGEGRLALEESKDRRVIDG